MMLLSCPNTRVTDRPHTPVRPHAPDRCAGPLPALLLASRSPRRRQLLDEAGISHRVIESGVDDGPLVSGAVTPDEWVMALAYLKAAAAHELLRTSGTAPPPGAVILGADTVVVDDGRLIGQPRSRADAARILRLLIDGRHEVLTGVALIDAESGRRELFASRASVAVGMVPEPQVTAYLDSGLWRGKAGAYNLSERLDDGWPITFDGDPGVIMGLPIRTLRERLAAFAAR